MTQNTRRIALLRRMAWLCAALVLAITSLSAFLRLSKSGNGCEPWPQCYGQNFRAARQGLQPQAAERMPAATLAARMAHRVIAMATLLLVILMVMTALWTRPHLWREGRMAIGLLALVLFLALLGRWTANARVPAVTLGNLLAGFGMFALSARLAQITGRNLTANTPAQGRIAAWAIVCAGLLVTQIALGGLVSATYAGPSCPQLMSCELGSATWQVFNPWHEPVLDPAQPGNAAGALVHVAHRVLALVLAAAVALLSAAAWRGGLRRRGTLLALLLSLQLALGVWLVLGALPLAIALAHNVVAALLLATLLGMTGGRPGRAFA